MAIGTAIFSILSADSTITAKVADRIFPSFVPQDTQFPAITYTIDGQLPTKIKDGVSKLDTADLVVTIYHEDYEEANTIADKVRELLDYYNGTQDGTTFNRISFDSQDDAPYIDLYEFFVIVQNYNVRIKR